MCGTTLTPMHLSERFTSLQGEGYWSGTPAAFVRMAGCNLACPFCDTDFRPTHTLNEEQLARWAQSTGMHHVVITGGEPALQLTPTLIESLHQKGLYVQVETNGTIPIPRGWGVDWITCSPKMQPLSAYRADATANPPVRGEGGQAATNEGRVEESWSWVDELKIVFTAPADVAPWEQVLCPHRFIQPCDTGDAARNQSILRAAIDYCLTHPQWRLSLQTHKILGIH